MGYQENGLKARVLDLFNRVVEIDGELIFRRLGSLQPEEAMHRNCNAIINITRRVKLSIPNERLN